MGRGQAGIMEFPMKHKPDQRYTQERGYGRCSRTHQEVKDANYRKPKLSEGVAFKEPI